jgi:hypothetical protein
MPVRSSISTTASRNTRAAFSVILAQVLVLILDLGLLLLQPANTRQAPIDEGVEIGTAQLHLVLLAVNNCFATPGR